MVNDKQALQASDLHEALAAFRSTGATKELVGQANEAVQEINSRRPLSEKVLERLQTDILYDRVHSSAVTEGNRLSRRETIVVLTTGLVEAGSRRDEVEVRNLGRAIIELEDALSRGESLNAQRFRHLHALLLRDIDDDAGAYRTENVAISGATVRPPHFHDVANLVESVLSHIHSEERDVSPVELAAWAHWSIARIHPFRDGNGRVARLVQDYVLWRARYVPAPLQVEDREGGYYAALEGADLGEGKELLELVAKNVLRMADRYLAIIRDEEAKSSWLANITRAATEKVRLTGHRRFLSLQRASNILKQEFDSLASELSEGIQGLRVRLRDYGGLSFDKFHEIERIGRAKKTWFFGVEFRVEETMLRYILWYGCQWTRSFATLGDAYSYDPVRWF